MSKKKAVFISVPMHGFTDVQIQMHILEAKHLYLEKTGLDILDVVFVDNHTCPPPPDLPSIELLPSQCLPLWYLGHAINKMAVVDEVIFYPGWEDARGCQIEHEVCHVYGIPFRYMEEV